MLSFQFECGIKKYRSCWRGHHHLYIVFINVSFHCLRIQLSTKEIASLLNVSVRAVEQSRYRLKKRLELESEVNLNQYIMQFKGE